MPVASDGPTLLGEQLLAESRLVRYERRVARAIHAALAKLEARTRADLRAVTAASWWDNPDGEQAVDDVLDTEVEPVVADVAREVVDAVLAVVPADVHRFGEVDVSAQVRRLVARVRDMTLATASEVGEQIRLGVARGESVPQLSSRVEDVFAASRQRATRIARTETISTTNGAAHDAAGMVHNGGQPLAKRWLSTLDERTRASHANAMSQRVAFDQEFEVGGTTLRYPGDPDGPAGEVINCRCTTVYEPMEPRAEQ